MQSFENMEYERSLAGFQKKEGYVGALRRNGACAPEGTSLSYPNSECADSKISSMERSGDETSIMPIRTKAGVWDYTLSSRNGSLVLSRSIVPCGWFQDEYEDTDEKRSIHQTNDLIRVEILFIQVKNSDVPRPLNPIANQQFEAHRHGNGGSMMGREAVIGDGSPASDSGRVVPARQDQPNHFVRADDEEMKIEVYVSEQQESVQVLFSKGFTIKNQQVLQWESGCVYFDLTGEDPNSAAVIREKILDAVLERALLTLELCRGGDYNSVVVLNPNFRRYLIRVKANADNFDERPLVNPWEEHCTSASRMIEYCLMIGMRDEVPLPAAAFSTNQYFGAAAFVSEFRSRGHFCNLMVGKKRADASIDEVYQTAVDLVTQSHWEAWDTDRLHGYTFGGDNPGPFETTLDEVRAMEYEIAYTRCFDGALTIILFPRSQRREVSIFHAGQRYPMRLDQVREASRSFCQVNIGTIANGLKVVGINKYLDGSILYCVSVESEYDESDINEFMMVYDHDLFPQRM